MQEVRGWLFCSISVGHALTPIISCVRSTAHSNVQASSHKPCTPRPALKETQTTGGMALPMSPCLWIGKLLTELFGVWSELSNCFPLKFSMHLFLYLLTNMVLFSPRIQLVAASSVIPISTYKSPKPHILLFWQKYLLPSLQRKITVLPIKTCQMHRKSTSALRYMALGVSLFFGLKCNAVLAHATMLRFNRDSSPALLKYQGTPK